MAVSLIAGEEKVRRMDLYHADPFGLVVNEEHRGRKDPPSTEAIIAMAESLLENGQQQAVTCRRLGDNRLMLVSGFTRVAAARLIRAGFTDSQGEFKQDEEFTIKFTLTVVNDEKALICNIVENAARNSTTPVDDALNQNKLRERYGYTDAAIARIYQCDQSKVSKLKKLLTLPGSIQDQVHTGKMSLSSALELVDLDSAKRDEVLAKAIEEGQTLTASQIRAQVRGTNFANRAPAALPAGVLNDDGNPNAASNNTSPVNGADKDKALSMREVRDFFVKLSGEDDEALSDLGDALVAWLRGSAPEEEVMRSLAELRTANAVAFTSFNEVVDHQEHLAGVRE